MSQAAVEYILRKCKLKPAEKLVLAIIASHGRGTNGSRAYLSATTIANEAGIHRTTVFRVLDDLHDKGWLSWTPGSAKENTANTYEIHLDPSSTVLLGPSRKSYQP